MPNPALDSLASYATPNQSQTPTQSEQPMSVDLSPPGQKRKRTAGSGPSTQPSQSPSPPGQQIEYEVPRFNKARSPAPPPSPTSEAVKRRKTLNQEHGPQATQEDEQSRDQTMAVDEEEDHQTEHPKSVRQDTLGTPLGTPTRHESPKEAPGSEQEDIFVEVDEAENVKTLARIMNVDEDSLDDNYQVAPPHPLDKYTKGPFPTIHDEDLASLLEGVSKTQFRSWLSIATGKVLARPFENDARFVPNRSPIARTIRTAVKEITGATRVTVAVPNDDADSSTKPLTFLIHNISKKDAETLLGRSVWSSKEITFQVAPINVKRPDFLFTLGGMTTDNTDHVLECIGKIWSDDATNNFVNKLANRAPDEEEQQDRLCEMIEYLDSLSIEYLDMKSEGNQENPHFNVYADGEVIKNNRTWIELRKFLRGRSYKSDFHGDGKATKTDYICSLCHGHDHPRGLCEFPRIPGWNGGGRNPPPPRLTPTEQPTANNYLDTAYNPPSEEDVAAPEAKHEAT